MAPCFPGSFGAAAHAVARFVVFVFDGRFAEVPDIAAIVLPVPISRVFQQEATLAVYAECTDGPGR
jgi:hypothetical protein